MIFHEGDMVRLNKESLAYVSRKLDAASMLGTVIKAKKREVPRSRRKGLHTELVVTNIVEVMWSDGTIQVLDGRHLEKIKKR